jgi:hypothetical protein
MIPESREARYSLRGKPQTSWWKAQRIADQTLVIRKVEPRPFDPERAKRIREEILGTSYKPQLPMIYAKLNQRPFQSRDQFLETLETK